MSHFKEYKSNTQAPDGRTLGDEWADWDGKGGGSIRTGKTLFLVIASIVLVLSSAGLYFSVYLISPRLYSWNSIFVNIAWISATVLIALFAGWWLFFSASIISGRNMFPFRKLAHLPLGFVISKSFSLAELAGVSRDRIGNSFVHISNALSMALKKAGADEKLLILLPRCLAKEELKQINDLKEKYPIEVHTVSGGELARKKVKELKPTAVIGVACERDLVSGIRDVGNRISVIGIPNQRPNGPCKDTHIDMAELINAIEFYVGKELSTSGSGKLPPIDTNGG